MSLRLIAFLIFTPLLAVCQNIRCGDIGTLELGTYDIQHIIPPQYARSGLSVGGDIDSGFLVLSTLSPIPITISIKNAMAFKNPLDALALSQTVSISITSPLVINLSQSPYGTRGYGTRNIISGNDGGKIDSTQGLIIQSSHPFYAIIRHKSGAQGNYLTSKGRLALGKRFRSGHIYNNSNVSNVKSEHISIMALEDGTIVNITDLPSGMIFINRPTFPITLKRYETFTLAALQDSGINNTLINQLNGALITSNKNITVVSGSFLGGGEGSGRDIGVDQIVPVDFLGQEFFIVKGMGSINMEVPMVIADKDGTDIFLNGSSVPVATINSGQHHMVFNQWGTDSTMIIKTSKPAYLYQSLGANNSNGNGFMIMAPLNLNLENQQLAIPQPSQIGTSTIYIVTYSTSIVKVNGSVITGGSAFSSNPNFVRYTITGSVNNTLIESSEAYFCTNVLLSGARGAGTSYTGFPNSFAVRDYRESIIGHSDTSNFLENDNKSIYDFKLDTICRYPKNGTIQILSNGNVVYTPFASANGCDSLIYSIKDSITGIYDQALAIYCLKLDLVLDSTTTIKCHGNSNGMIKVKAQGGQPNYFYSKKTKSTYGKTQDTFEASNTFSGLSADTFIIKVIDAKGNTDTVSIILNQPSKLVAKIDSVSKTSICIRDSIRFFASSKGGILNYKYLWTPKLFFKNDTLQNNTAHPKNSEFIKFSVIDSNLCISSDSIYINISDSTRQDSFLTICKNQPLVFNNLILNTSGLYKDTLINVKGCDSFLYLHLTVNDTTRKDSFLTICKNQPIVFKGNVLNTTGVYRDTLVNSRGCDSFLVLSLTVRDTTNYFFTKNICHGDSFTFNQITHFRSGNFKDTATNALGCDSFIYLNLVEIPLPTADAGIDKMRVNCKGDSVQIGSITVPNIDYTWNPNSFISDISGSQPWVKPIVNSYYTLKAKDRITNCVNYDTVKVTVQNVVLTNTLLRQNLSCFGENSGKITMIATGGYRPYMYWTTGKLPQADSFVTGLSARLDTFYFEDAKGCEFKDTFSLKEPPKLIVTLLAKKNLKCYKENIGELEVITTGGSGGNKYKWSRSSDTLAKSINLASGIHTVTVEDKNGCKYSRSDTLTEPSDFVITADILNNKCYGDSSASIKLNVSGATPSYSYKWSNDSSKNVIINLKNGEYKVTIKDINACESKRIYSIVDPSKLILDSIKSMPDGCSNRVNGELTIYARGEREFLYSIDSGINYSRDSIFKNIQADVYNIVVRDKNGCILRGIDSVKKIGVLKLTFEPRDTSIKLGEVMNVKYTVNEGQLNWIDEIHWKPSEGLSCTDCINPIINNYLSQVYTVKIRYFKDCYLEESIKIRVISDDEVYIPNAFSPQAIVSNENKILKVYGKNLVAAHLKIFNRWGEKVYETENAHLEGWDGLYKGNPQPSGNYIYYLEVEFLDRRRITRRSEFNLIR